MSGQTPYAARERQPAGTLIEPSVIKAEAVRRPIGWYLRRGIIGLAIMLVAVATGAWVFHSTIEAEAGDGSKFGTYAD